MAIIGHGDVASGILDSNKFLFFCSGVSNSKEVRLSEFHRESELLLDQDRGERLVYFSTLSILTADTPYTRHKRAMEKLVKANFDRNCIIRLGNIAFGKNNPHTLINYLRGKIERGEPFEIQDVHRHVVNLTEFRFWLNLIPEWNIELSIPGEFLTVEEIVKRIKQGTL